MPNETPQFSTWFEQRYLKWQTDMGHRASMRDFAKWLEIDHSMVVRLMNGTVSKPRGEAADLLAAKLGPEVYEILGMPKTDPLLLKVKTGWDKFSAAQRDSISRVLSDPNPPTISEIIKLFASLDDEARADILAEVRESVAVKRKGKQRTRS